MSASIVCFFIESTDKVQRYLRRFVSAASSASDGHYHDAMVPLDIVPVEKDEAGYIINGRVEWPHTDPRWPIVCSQCGYIFTEDDRWQVFIDQIYRRTDTGAEMSLREAPPGAMWYADWMIEGLDTAPDKMGNLYRGPDGHCLMVRCPDGWDWMVDAQASNCTLKHDRMHKCWPRRGAPPNVTVDKSFGPTCSAGAGSILTPKWHGFLRDGKLVS